MLSALRNWLAPKPARTTRPRFGCERLEDRSVPSVTPLDPVEATVHTPTADSQGLNGGMDGGGGQHTVAADAAGNYVVVWEATPAAGGDPDVYARRFAADGSPRGSEFRVNTTTAGRQSIASVAADAAGNFVVVWQQGDWLTKATVKGRLYRADGTARTGELTLGSGNAQPEDVAMDASGDFVVVYHTASKDRKFYAQRYNADAQAQGKAISLGSVNYPNQEATVGMDAVGNFVISWEGSNTVRRYDRLGNLQQTITLPPTGRLWVDMNAGGEFVVARTFDNGPGAETVVYHANGSVKTTLTLPPDTVPGPWEVRAVALADDGSLALGYNTWTQLFDPVTGAAAGWETDVAVRVYDPTGVLLGSAPLATVTEGNQSKPGLVQSADGTFVAVWDGVGPGDDQGVFARRFAYTADLLSIAFPPDDQNDLP